MTTPKRSSQPPGQGHDGHAANSPRSLWRPRSEELQLYATFALIGFGNQLVPALVRPIKAEFALSDSNLGFYYFVTATAFGIGALGGGVIAEILGRRLLIAAALVGIAVGQFVAGLAPEWAVFFAAGLVGGVGVGSAEATSSGLILDLRPENRTAALNLLNVFFSAGALVAPLTVGILLGAGLSWRSFMFAVGAAALTLVVLRLKSWSGSRDRMSGARGPATQPASIPHGEPSPPFRIGRDLALMGVAVACYVACEFGVSNWLVRFLAAAPMTVATGALAFFWAAHMTGRLAAVRYADRLSALTLAIACAALGGVALIGAALSPTLPLSLLLFGVGGLAVGPIFPTMLAAAGARHPGRSTSVSGFLLAASITGAVAYPPLMGVISDAAGLQPAMAGAGMMSLACCCALVAARALSAPAPVH